MLPLELQYLVIEQVALDPHDSFQDQRRHLAKLCLISQSWRAEAQPFLFEAFSSLNADPLKTLRPFLYALRSSPHLRPFVRSIALDRVSADATDILLRHVGLLPDLAHLAGLVWPTDPLLVPPPPEDRPALESLSIDVEGALVGVCSPLSAWFDLSGLQRFAAYAADDPFRNTSFLADIPLSCGDITLEFFDGDVYGPLLGALAGRERLTHLTLRAETALDMAVANPLALLPGLTTLSLRGVDDLCALVAGKVAHPALQHLAVTSAWDEDFDGEEQGAVPLSHQLHAFAAALRHAVDPPPTADGHSGLAGPSRLPALASVSVGAEELWFTFGSAGERAEDGVGPLVRELQAAGLAVSDRFGIEWPGGRAS